MPGTAGSDRRGHVTIDPVDARDFDDAISLDRLENGNWRLGVHIADVSHFVRPRTPLDREARQRATSVYLPDRVVPMLPEIISNGLASLQPEKLRYTKTAFLEFSPEGIATDVELHNSAHPQQQAAYLREVDAVPGRPPRQRKLGAEVLRLAGADAPVGDDSAPAAFDAARWNSSCAK